LLKLNEEVSVARITALIEAYLGSKDRFVLVRNAIALAARTQLEKMLLDPCFASHHDRIAFLLKHLGRQSLHCISAAFKALELTAPRRTLDCLPTELLQRIVQHVGAGFEAERNLASEYKAAAAYALLEGRPSKLKKPVLSLQSLTLVNRLFRTLTKPLIWSVVSLQKVSNRALLRLADQVEDPGLGQLVKMLDANVLDGSETIVPADLRAAYVDERVESALGILEL
jgi:hypothetical protein